jgi:hypothetical protein
VLLDTLDAGELFYNKKSGHLNKMNLLKKTREKYEI